MFSEGNLQRNGELEYQSCSTILFVKSVLIEIGWECKFMYTVGRNNCINTILRIILSPDRICDYKIYYYLKKIYMYLKITQLY